MSFRAFNQKYFEPGSMIVMVLGIVFLCQPWVPFLHQWSVLVMLAGLIAFNVAAHVPPPEPAPTDEDDTGPVSLSAATRGSDHHG